MIKPHVLSSGHSGLKGPYYKPPYPLKKVSLSAPLGCYIGDGVWQNACNDVHILCHGSPDVECTSFPNQNFRVYQLYVIDDSCTNPIDAGMAYLQYFDSTSNIWTNINSLSVPIYYGYANVWFDVSPNGWSGKMRINWQCQKEWFVEPPPPPPPPQCTTPVVTIIM